jgi:hypothetical protein
MLERDEFIIQAVEAGCPEDQAWRFVAGKVFLQPKQLYQTLGPNVVSYQDNSVIISHLYTYYVTAFNAVGESAPSNESGVVCGSG